MKSLRRCKKVQYLKGKRWMRRSMMKKNMMRNMTSKLIIMKSMVITETKKKAGTTGMSKRSMARRYMGKRK
jgi:ribosomal protein L17